MNDALAAQQVEELAKVIQGRQERFKKLTSQSSSMTLVSPMDGVFVDAIDIPSHSDFGGNRISDRWTHRNSGTNRGVVERGQMVGQITPIASLWEMATSLAYQAKEWWASRLVLPWLLVRIPHSVELIVPLAARSCSM